jgi:hypothetical protein
MTYETAPIFASLPMLGSFRTFRSDGTAVSSTVINGRLQFTLNWMTASGSRRLGSVAEAKRMQQSLSIALSGKKAQRRDLASAA